MEYFGLYYLIICLIGIVCAIILPRIPPLSFEKDDYLVEGMRYQKAFRRNIILRWNTVKPSL